MAVEVRREGVLDYILAGVAGVAKGAQTGIEKRQAGERQAAVQKAMNDYKTATLGLQERGLDIEEEGQKLLTKFRQQQQAATLLMPWMQDRFIKKQIKARDEEERKTLKFKAGLPSIGKDLLDIEEQQVKIEGMRQDKLLGESLVNQRQAVTALNSRKQDFTEGQATVENMQWRTELLANAATHIWDAETAVEIKRFDASFKEWSKKGDLSDISMHAIENVNFWQYMAATAPDDRRKQEAVVQVQKGAKERDLYLKEFDGIEYKGADVIYNDRQWPLKNRVEVSGEPSVTLPDRGAKPTLAEPQSQGFMNQILGFLGEQQAAEPQAALPQYQQPIGPEVPAPTDDPFRATPEEKQEVISKFKTAKIKKLNPETIRRLEVGGFTPEDIAEITKAIK